MTLVEIVTQLKKKGSDEPQSLRLTARAIAC